MYEALLAGAKPKAMEELDESDPASESCILAMEPVFIVSDCTGESAEHTVNCALGQFNHCFERDIPAEITTFRFCSEGMIESVVQEAKKKEAFVVYTLVEPSANKRMGEMCAQYGVKHHDLWSPLLEGLEGYFQAHRNGIPNRDQGNVGKYSKLIDCIQYTRELDDGVQPNRWGEADLMVVGPSRSGKTPLAFFMAQRGFKVANYPLVPDEPIPKEMWDFPQNRVFALYTDANKLATFRHTRMRTLKMSSSSSYAQTSKVMEELAWCKRLYDTNPSWTVLNTTDSSIEENCTRILKNIELLEGSLRTRDNPSAI